MKKKLEIIFLCVTIIISLVGCEKANNQQDIEDVLGIDSESNDTVDKIDENSELSEDENEGITKLNKYLDKYDEESRQLHIRKLDLDFKNKKKKPISPSPVFGMGFEKGMDIPERYKVIDLVSIDEKLKINVESDLTEGQISYYIYSPDGVLQKNKIIKKEELLLDEYVFDEPQLGLWLFEIQSEKDTIGKIDFYIYCD